ncbi:unnamed protein product [Amoebophrya sp. A25]|nr:unnamed protein product [Amoebophrya sp. A25]|eukprot:GSA25T00017498001.1
MALSAASFSILATPGNNTFSLPDDKATANGLDDVSAAGCSTSTTTTPSSWEKEGLLESSCSGCTSTALHSPRQEFAVLSSTTPTLSTSSSCCGTASVPSAVVFLLPFFGLGVAGGSGIKATDVFQCSARTTASCKSFSSILRKLLAALFILGAMLFLVTHPDSPGPMLGCLLSNEERPGASHAQQWLETMGVSSGDEIWTRPNDHLHQMVAAWLLRLPRSHPISKTRSGMLVQGVTLHRKASNTNRVCAVGFGKTMTDVQLAARLALTIELACVCADTVDHPNHPAFLRLYDTVRRLHERDRLGNSDTMFDYAEVTPVDESKEKGLSTFALLERSLSAAVAANAVVASSKKSPNLDHDVSWRSRQGAAISPGNEIEHESKNRRPSKASTRLPNGVDAPPDTPTYLRDMKQRSSGVKPEGSDSKKSSSSMLAASSRGGSGGMKMSDPGSGMSTLNVLYNTQQQIVQGGTAYGGGGYGTRHAAPGGKAGGKDFGKGTRGANKSGYASSGAPGVAPSTSYSQRNTQNNSQFNDISINNYFIYNYNADREDQAAAGSTAMGKNGRFEDTAAAAYYRYRDEATAASEYYNPNLYAAEREDAAQQGTYFGQHAAPDATAHMLAAGVAPTTASGYAASPGFEGSSFGPANANAPEFHPRGLTATTARGPHGLDQHGYLAGATDASGGAGALASYGADGSWVDPTTRNLQEHYANLDNAAAAFGAAQDSTTGSGYFGMYEQMARGLHGPPGLTGDHDDPQSEDPHSISGLSARFNDLPRVLQGEGEQSETGVGESVLDRFLKKAMDEQGADHPERTSNSNSLLAALEKSTTGESAARDRGNRRNPARGRAQSTSSYSSDEDDDYKADARHNVGTSNKRPGAPQRSPPGLGASSKSKSAKTSAASSLRGGAAVTAALGLEGNAAISTPGQQKKTTSKSSNSMSETPETDPHMQQIFAMFGDSASASGNGDSQSETVSEDPKPNVPSFLNSIAGSVFGSFGRSGGNASTKNKKNESGCDYNSNDMDEGMGDEEVPPEQEVPTDMHTAADTTTPDADSLSTSALPNDATPTGRGRSFSGAGEGLGHAGGPNSLIDALLGGVGANDDETSTNRSRKDSDSMTADASPLPCDDHGFLASLMQEQGVAGAAAARANFEKNDSYPEHVGREQRKSSSSSASSFTDDDGQHSSPARSRPGALRSFDALRELEDEEDPRDAIAHRNRGRGVQQDDDMDRDGEDSRRREGVNDRNKREHWNSRDQNEPRCGPSTFEQMQTKHKGASSYNDRDSRRGESRSMRGQSKGGKDMNNSSYGGGKNGSSRNSKIYSESEADDHSEVNVTGDEVAAAWRWDSNDATSSSWTSAAGYGTGSYYTAGRKGNSKDTSAKSGKKGSGKSTGGKNNNNGISKDSTGYNAASAARAGGAAAYYGSQYSDMNNSASGNYYAGSTTRWEPIGSSKGGGKTADMMSSASATTSATSAYGQQVPTKTTTTVKDDGLHDGWGDRKVGVSAYATDQQYVARSKTKDREYASTKRTPAIPIESPPPPPSDVDLASPPLAEALPFRTYADAIKKPDQPAGAATTTEVAPTVYATPAVLANTKKAHKLKTTSKNAPASDQDGSAQQHGSAAAKKMGGHPPPSSGGSSPTMTSTSGVVAGDQNMQDAMLLTKNREVIMLENGKILDTMSLIRGLSDGITTAAEQAKFEERELQQKNGNDGPGKKKNKNGLAASHQDEGGFYSGIFGEAASTRALLGDEYPCATTGGAPAAQKAGANNKKGTKDLHPVSMGSTADLLRFQSESRLMKHGVDMQLPTVDAIAETVPAPPTRGYMLERILEDVEVAAPLDFSRFVGHARALESDLDGDYSAYCRYNLFRPTPVSSGEEEQEGTEDASAYLIEQPGWEQRARGLNKPPSREPSNDSRPSKSGGTKNKSASSATKQNKFDRKFPNPALSYNSTEQAQASRTTVASSRASGPMAALLQLLSSNDLGSREERDHASVFWLLMQVLVASMRYADPTVVVLTICILACAYFQPLAPVPVQR